MTVSTEFRVEVGDLLRRPGTRRVVRVGAPVVGLGAGMIAIPDDRPVEVDLTVESLTTGIVVRGEVSVAWRAGCARCLEPFASATRVHVDELFEAVPTEGETYLLDGDTIDLEQMVRDALVLEFPLAPAPALDATDACTVCDRRPADLAPERPADDLDPRWDALRALDL